MKIWGRSIPGKRSSKFKDSDMRIGVACWANSEKMSSGEGNMAGGEVR